jgi:hypothetical protein
MLDRARFDRNDSVASWGVKTDTVYSDRKLRLVAVSERIVHPGGIGDFGVFDPADPRQRLSDEALFYFQLSVIRAMLKTTAPAPSEHRARGRNAMRRGPDDINRFGVGVIRVHFQNTRARRLAGQSAVYKRDEPFRPADAEAFLVNVIYR